jgi:hypothetical protein
MNLLYEAVDPQNNISIDLPDDLYWSDEFAWCPVAQQQDRTLQGTLIVEESVMTAGRPITLEGADDMAWVTREKMLQLETLRNMSGTVFTLTMKDDRSFTVRFNNAGVSVDTRPLMTWKQTDNKDWYVINALRFLEV